MSSLDLSSLKKASQDQKIAVLIHPDGHKVHIAIGALSPAMRKKLDDMPLHKSGDGEEPEQAVVEAPSAAEDDDEPNYAGVAGAADAATLGATPHAPQDSTLPDQPASVPPEDTGSGHVDKDGTIVSVAPRIQQKIADTLGFAQDMSMGHIQPKTYHDLYNDKSFLGKTGTIMGLLLSGAGSGLTHQPNAVMDMMNKQIENDFQAQKDNQANKRSWYQLTLDHARNEAGNALTNAQTSLEQQKGAAQKYINQQTGIDTGDIDTDGINRATIGVLQNDQNNINLMQPGPLRDQAQAQHDNILVPAMTKSMKQRIVQNESRKAFVAANTPQQQKSNPPPSKGAPESGKKYDAYDKNKYAAMVQKGKFAPNAPNAISPQESSAIDDEAKRLETNRDNLADADDVFNKIQALKNGGQVPISGLISGLGTGLAGLAGSVMGPTGAMAAGAAGNLLTRGAGESVQQYFERGRNVLKEAFKARVGKNMSEEDKEKLANSILPNYADTPETEREAHNQLVEHFASNPDEHAPVMERKGLKYPIPKYAYKPFKAKEEKKSPAPAPTPTVTGFE